MHQAILLDRSLRTLTSRSVSRSRDLRSLRWSALLSGHVRPRDQDSELQEPWLTKQQLADHLAVSDRWIEMQQHVGLPYLRMGGLNRYRASGVEAWLRGHYNASPESE
jgi:hypothetical protein